MSISILLLLLLLLLIALAVTGYSLYVLFNKATTLEIVNSELRAELNALRRAVQDESFQTTAALTELHASIPVSDSTDGVVERVEEQALQFLDLVQTTESCLESLSKRVDELERLEKEPKKPAARKRASRK